MAKVPAMAVVFALSGCAYGPSPGVGGPPPPVPLALPAPGSGLYCLAQGGTPVGEERYTVTASGAVWRAEGRQRFWGPAGLSVEYQLWAEAGGDPLGLQLEVAVAGEARRVSARRRGPWWEVQAEGAGGASQRRVAWAPGTWIGFPSPLFEALALADPGRRGPGSSAGRAILMVPPDLSPSVRWAEIQARGADGLGARYLIRPGEGLGPVGIWLGEDGLPNRVRRFLEGGPPLEAVRSSTCARPRTSSGS